jgi:secretion/DNA translocation related TadE-like protein
VRSVRAARDRCRRQRGSITVLAVAMAAVLLLVGCGLAMAVGLVRAHRSAESAADLAALAGARGLQSDADGCDAATRIASANDARLTSCRVDGRDVVVSVKVSGPQWLRLRADLAAEARAGPG